jgi:tetratricopeptide (TPR) repeat protein
MTRSENPPDISMIPLKTLSGETIGSPLQDSQVEMMGEPVDNPQKIETQISPLVQAPHAKKVVHHKVKDTPPKDAHKVEHAKNPHSLKPEKKEKLIEITGNVKTLIARGQIDDARALIVSGLAIEKSNRELNLLMASLYERDHAFEKAEFILKDIATNSPDDIEILTHLATDLAMQRKYDVSYELYKKILSLGGENEETLYTLAHLASEMDLPDDVTLYARVYLKQYPHNPEILWLYSQSQIAHGERREAVETLIKLKNLTPYNQEIADLIQKLMTEEELAGNFGEGK